MRIRQGRPTRRGLSSIPAMVCLVLVTLLSGVLLKQVRMQRNAVRDEERRSQADWLAESGLARASAKLAADPKYAGETWAPPAEALGGRKGEVRITLDDVKDRPGARRVRVQADFPLGDERRARQTKTLIIDLGPGEPGGPS